jgi:hypothetical protein
MSDVMPLFGWRRNKRLLQLEMERAALIAQINKLPKHSHRRIKLEARAAGLVERSLELQWNAQPEWKG